VAEGNKHAASLIAVFFVGVALPAEEAQEDEVAVDLLWSHYKNTKTGYGRKRGKQRENIKPIQQFL